MPSKVEEVNSTTRKIYLASLLLGAFLLLNPVAISVRAVNDGTPPAHMTNLAWHNGQLWNSVVLGPLHGPVPAQTLDAFYMIAGQNPVAGDGPGDSDYDGGRWLPLPITCPSGCPLFTDGDQVEAALMAGTAVKGTAGTPFLCPLTNPNA